MPEVKALQSLCVSTPGRICLFGEHQDYLSLPVIPCAISLRIAIEGTRRTDMQVHLQMPDIDGHESFSLDGPLPYTRPRDYVRSAVNILRRHGFTFSSGFDCRVSGNIPINAGTSSSSALIVSWIHFLIRMSDQAPALPARRMAELAHEAEVLEFGEPGGMMDHYSTAGGGILHIAFAPNVVLTELSPVLGDFVLGNSGEPKDTTAILARVKTGILDIVADISVDQPGFTLEQETPESVERFRGVLAEEQFSLLRGTVRNHHITGIARALLQTVPLNHLRLGALLTEHHEVLRDVLGISTPKIDRMLSAACDAGALGGKINGSGGGGCMFAYAPGHTREVAEAIENAGGRAYTIRPDVGTRIEAGGGGA